MNQPIQRQGSDQCFWLFTLVAASLLGSPLKSTGQGFVWAKLVQYAGDVSTAKIAVDEAGNSFVTGSFYGTVTIGTTNLTSAGETAGFLAKYDQEGNFNWVIQFGGATGAIGYGVVLDKQTNCYLAGSFGGSATFGNTNLTTVGGADAFLARLDSSGHFRWVRQIGGHQTDEAFAVAVDPSGNPFVTGYFNEKASFDGTDLTYLVNAGGDGIFVAKYSATGQFLWARGAGTPIQSRENGNKARALAVDAAGSVYVTGNIYGPVSFGGIALTNYGFEDAFVAKYDRNGNLIWAQSAGGPKPDAGRGIAVDSSNNVFVTGSFNLVGNFGTTNVSYAPPAPDTDTAFLAKYSTTGTLLWARLYDDGQNTRGTGSGYALTADPSGNAYLTGFALPVGFFISKYTSGGGLLWSISANVRSAGTGIALDNQGDIHVSGAVSAPTYFDGIFLTTSTPDGFVLKVSERIPPYIVIPPTALYVRVGMAGGLGVSARSIGPIAYQWTINGTNIVGATNSSLSISNAITDQTGLYQVQLSNSYGTTLTLPVAAEVDPFAVTGQWDFDADDLSPTVGAALEYFGDTAGVTTFTNSVINGREARVMAFPACGPQQGYVIHHGAQPNDGGLKVNEWTLIMDVLWHPPGGPGLSSFIQIDSLENTNGGELFAIWQSESMAAIGVIGPGIYLSTNVLIQADSWHRIAFVVYPGGSGIVVVKYVDGKLAQYQQAGAYSLDSRFGLSPSALLFADGNGQTSSGLVNSIQFRNYMMSASEIAALGGPSADGIPLLKFKPPSIQGQGTSRLVVDNPLTEIPPGFALYGASTLAGPSAAWLRLTNLMHFDNGLLSVDDLESTGAQQRFYSLQKAR